MKTQQTLNNHISESEILSADFSATNNPAFDAFIKDFEASYEDGEDGMTIGDAYPDTITSSFINAL